MGADGRAWSAARSELFCARSALIRAARSAARVVLRLGIINARLASTGGACGGGGGGAETVVSQSGKNIRQPGWVV